MDPSSASDAACVVGIDFGTDSVRSVVVDAGTGAMLGRSVKPYPRWARGLYCDPVENRFRQHPLDYVESMSSSVVEALLQAGPSVSARVRGIAHEHGPVGGGRCGAREGEEQGKKTHGGSCRWDGYIVSTLL